MLHRFTWDEEDQLYMIQWNLHKNVGVEIGKLGSFHFQQGIYVYIGSARKNIGSRIERHLTINKKNRWHMDYLRPYLEPAKVITVPFHKGECDFKKFIQKKFFGEMVMKGFGSSDCTCDSHLLKIPNPVGDEDDVRSGWLHY